MKIKLNKDILNHKAGKIIRIPDKDGIPTERYWRNRLRDSKIDNCIEIVEKTKQKKEPKIKGE